MIHPTIASFRSWTRAALVLTVAAFAGAALPGRPELEMAAGLDRATAAGVAHDLPGSLRRGGLAGRRWTDPRRFQPDRVQRIGAGQPDVEIGPGIAVEQA